MTAARKHDLLLEIKKLQIAIDLKEGFLAGCKSFHDGYFLTLADVRHLKVKLEGKKRLLANEGYNHPVREAFTLPSNIQNRIKQ